MKKIIVLGAMSVLLADTLFAMEAQNSETQRTEAPKIKAQNSEGLAACISELPQELISKIVSLSLESHIAKKYRFCKTIYVDCFSSVAFSADGKTVLIGSRDNTVRLWDLDKGKVLKEFTGHIRSLASVAFSPDDKTVLAGSYNATVILWEIENGTQLQQFDLGEYGISSLAFSSQGPLIVYGKPDETCLWDRDTGCRQRFAGYKECILSVALSPDSTTVLTGSDKRIARLWDVDTGKVLQQFVGHTSDVTSVAFSPDGKTVLTGSEDNTARLWDVETGKEIRRFTEHRGHINSVAFSPDGKTILTGSSDTTARLWDVETGKELQSLQCDYSILSVTFSPDGNTIAVCISGGYLSIFRRGIRLEAGTPHFLEMKQEAYTLFKEKELYHVLSKDSSKTTKEF